MTDSQQNPSIYEEAMEMLLGSLVIYIFAELREMIREEQMPKEDESKRTKTTTKTESQSDPIPTTRLSLTIKDLEPPLTAHKALEIIQTHKAALIERAISHEDLESRLQALKQLQQIQIQGTNGTENTPKDSKSLGSIQQLFSIFCGGLLDYSKPELTTTTTTTTSPQEGAVLKQFVDDNAKEELVHALVVNPVKKRITVVFRGSVTPKDFLQDAKCAQLKVENPVYQQILANYKDSLDGKTTKEIQKEIQMTATIGIHTGFYEYLHHVRKEDRANDTNNVTRLQEILRDTISLLREHPGFSLYVTGHSLGGALSTLFGFYAAANEELVSLLPEKQPVLVYSIASPYCGNWKFRHAFQELERQGRIQHLRISNHEDMVTLLPFAVPKATFLSPAVSMVRGGGNLYKHVGIQLQMKGPEAGQEKSLCHHIIRYPKDHHCADDDEYAKELQDALDAGRSLVKAFFHICTNDFEAVEKAHSCDQYELRLEACKDGLKNLTLAGLYCDTNVVGKLISEEYSPSLMPSSGIKRTMRALRVFTTRRKQEGITDTSFSDDDSEQLTLREAARRQE